MTKEYLKMADAFVHDGVEALEQHIYAGYMSKHCCEYAAHAINSHDELVAEVERLQTIISALLRTTESISHIDKKSGGWGSGYVDCANDISKALKEMMPLA